MSLFGKNEINKQDPNLQIQNEYLQKKAEVDKLIQEYIQRHQELDAREARLSEREATLEQALSEWNNKINFVKKKVGEAEDALIQKENTLRDLDNKIAQKQQEFEAQIAQKQQELADYEAKVAQAKADYEARVSQINAKLSEAKSNYSSLLQELKELQQQIKELRSTTQIKIGKITAVGEDEQGKFLVYNAGNDKEGKPVKIRTHLKEDLQVKVGDIAVFIQDLAGNSTFLGLLVVPKKREEPKPEPKSQQAEQKPPTSTSNEDNTEQNDADSTESGDPVVR